VSEGLRKNSFAISVALLPGKSSRAGDFIHIDTPSCGQAVQKKNVWRLTLTYTNGSGFVEKKAGVFCLPEDIRLVLSSLNLVLKGPIGLK